MASIRNIALQHHEFELRLKDAERLRLYIQAGLASREMKNASLKKVELACHLLELEAKNPLRGLPGPKLRETQRFMRLLWPSCRPRGPLAPVFR